MTGLHHLLPKGWQVVQFGDVVRNVDVNDRKPLENGLSVTSA